MTATDLQAARAVPLTVLTGFLGAGKTTLLYRILTGDHGLRVAVLVNDFGSINIDAELVVGVEDDGNVISLANGCVCCNVRDDLVAAVTQVIARPEQPEYILLEASGVADPSGIALTFMNEGMRNDGTEAAPSCVRRHAHSQQGRSGHTRGDRAGQGMVGRSVPPLSARTGIGWKRAVEKPAVSRPVDPSRLDGTPAHDQLNHRSDCDDSDCGHHVHGHGHDHSQVFRTWSYEMREPLSLEALRETACKLPASSYRCKGVIHAAEEPGRRVILQVVGKRVDIGVGDDWNGQERRTRIEAIGARDGMDGAALRQDFDGCRKAPVSLS